MKTKLTIDGLKEGIKKMLPTQDLPYKTFKVETTRTNKNFELNSPQISSQLGAYVLDNYEISVDVRNPDLKIHINIAEQEGYVFLNKQQGIRGLPVKSSGKVVSLLSGGIDSPVASFMMMKRGCEVVAMHAYNKTLNPQKVKDKVAQLSKQLAKFQGKFKLYLTPYEDIQREIVQGAQDRRRMILFKRSILRVAQHIARKEKAGALILGDSLGQVASQTLENIQCIYDASKLPVLSPLIGRDKEEIIALSQKIDTYETSILPHDDCCSLIASTNPQTRGRLAKVLEVEAELILDHLEEQAANEAEILTF